MRYQRSNATPVTANRQKLAQARSTSISKTKGLDWQTCECPCIELQRLFD